MLSDPATPSTSEPSRDDAPVRVLVVDDHLDLIANVFAWLERRNFVLDAARDGESALALCAATHYDVLVLDWMLPRLDGLVVLQRLRALGVDTPTLMLTARSDLSDKLSGFAAGVDDYLTKPFSLAELEARILALHARRVGRTKVLRVGTLNYDLASHCVLRDGEPVSLQGGPLKLLRLLMQESPNVVSKDRLESLLWGENRPDADLLRTHIYELRKRLDGAHAEKYLRTVPRLGYRIVDPQCTP